MCLIIDKEKTPTRASQDIVVYKIVEELTLVDGQLMTPFQQKPVAIGLTYRNNGSYEVKSSKDNPNESEIREGMFHSYPDLQEAERAKTIMEGINSNRKFKIAMCIIPKHSLFIEGYSMIYHTCFFWTVEEYKFRSVGSTMIKYVACV